MVAKDGAASSASRVPAEQTSGVKSEPTNVADASASGDSLVHSWAPGSRHFSIDFGLSDEYGVNPPTIEVCYYCDTNLPTAESRTGLDIHRMYFVLHR